MRKLTDAPKDVADIIKRGILVSKEEAFGNDWKKLPVGSGTRAKATKRIPNRHVRVATSKKKTVRASTLKINKGSVEVSFANGVRLKVQGTPSESYAKGLAKAVKDYIK